MPNPAEELGGIRRSLPKEESLSNSPIAGVGEKVIVKGCLHGSTSEEPLLHC